MPTKLALIQQRATPDKQANIQTGLANVDRAAANGATIVVFAELAFERFHPRITADEHERTTGTPVADLAEPIPGPTTDLFQQKAREHGIVIAINLFERCQPTDASGNPIDDAPPLTYDSSPVIDADGTLLGITRMTHITDYAWFHEAGYYAPGDSGMPVYATRHGNIGIAICYDRHFPESMRALALGGAELVIVPQAGAVGEWPDGLYEAELRVAAFQNGYFTALCNRVGPEGGVEDGAENDTQRIDFAGESFVCSPRGEVLARADTGTDEILYATLDFAEVPKSHARELFLRHRRPELYADWLT
ncbi:MAG: nitrilase-related carbon-nitrogen hydrolase [Planctomycetota bacterium]|jgi:N-carbamoylputrescine amidase